MSDACLDYLSWDEATKGGVQSGECYFYWEPACERGPRAMAGEACPWAGRPGNAVELSGRWDPPPRAGGPICV